MSIYDYIVITMCLFSTSLFLYCFCVDPLKSFFSWFKKHTRVFNNNINAGNGLIVLAVFVIAIVLLYFFAWDYVLMIYDAITGFFTGIMDWFGGL